MKEQKNLEKEQRKLRKVNAYGYLYLFITIILKKLFKIFNIEIKRKRKNFDEIYQYNLINKKKIYIFDIGANTGQCIRRFKGIFPNSIIHSFEPIKEVFDILKKNFISKNIVINNYACGDKNSFKNFNFNKLSYTSSFLEINKKNKRAYLFQNKKINKIKIIKLDNYIKQHDIKCIDILKVDAQGYELKILKGGEKSLKKIKFIEIEVTLDDIYINNPSLYQIDYIMYKNNFILYQIGEFEYENTTDRLLSIDLLYKNLNKT
jgi:FkbM family methyltransferase